jgi:hypothetical protein
MSLGKRNPLLGSGVCWQPLVFLGLQTRLTMPVIRLSIPCVSPCCLPSVYVCAKIFHLYLDASHIGLGFSLTDPMQPHFNLITSLKILFPNNGLILRYWGKNVNISFLRDTKQNSSPSEIYTEICTGKF